jgi:glycosyltransferase involved in cell wall biosynthesis
MIRLLCIQAVAERGGSDHALVRMLRSLPSDEFDCHVAVPQEPPLRDDLEAAGAIVHIVPMRRISSSYGIGDWIRYALAWPGSVWRLARLARATHADVVHTNVLHSWYGWAAAAIARRPHVWHAREIVVQSALALRLERLLTRFGAVRVIAMSHAIGDQLPRADVIVVYELPDARDFSPRNAGVFRSTVGIADDVPLAGCIGRIDTWKGFDVLLDAFSAVRERLTGAELVVAGGPVEGKETYARDLAVRAAGMPGVHWLGPRTDVAALLADLDVFVLPSTEPEPYGLVLVEALASGCPAVATDAGGAREIVAFAAPGAGRLVPIRDPAALADAIVASLTATGVTSGARRAGRERLVPDTADTDFADIFRAVARR